MNTVQKAKQYIDCMKATDSTSEHFQLISDLLMEIKGLKIQVCDRGNGWRKAIEKNKQLRKTLREVSGCYANHGGPKLCDGCLISINEALEE